MWLSIAVILLILLVVFQVAKASEYVAVLRGKDKAFKQSNKVNGFLMITFLVLGLIGVYWCNKILYPKTNLHLGSSSIEGEQVDTILWITIGLTGFVFLVTQILLFWFAFRYQHKEGRKSFFYPHNSKLEIVWTTVPTIVLAVLIVFGLRSWALFTGDAPKNAMQIEVTGKQFGWIFRYPGKDGVFGKKYFRNIDETNALGLIWKDSAAMGQKADPAAMDDIVAEATVHIVKNKPVKFIINSRDVIHDFGLSWFRMKMDAVPGTPTSLWFTPKYTTKEMIERTGNPNFAYEVSCDQLCGNGHYSMKGTIIVETQAEYDAWLAKQTSAYATAFPATVAIAAPATTATADSTVAAPAGK